MIKKQPKCIYSWGKMLYYFDIIAFVYFTTKFRCTYAQLFRLIKAAKQKYVTKMMNIVLKG